MNLVTCSKRYTDFPFAHRQPLHDGHCRFLHGHNWSFELTFASKQVDENGFVVDFGKLGYVKEWLTSMFDHTLVVPEYDREIPTWQTLASNDLVDLRIVADASCEGIASLVMDICDQLVSSNTNGRVRVLSVRVWEDERNSTTVYQPDDFMATDSRSPQE
jgi:6-pyruvoyltetrahydropterin/6-carboxytetrahydropterin synthase